MPLVSVIVPIYNAGEYLRMALDSLVGQTLADIEIVCVNDGSTDGSLDVIREYAACDGRVKVVDKPNGGYGHSMNAGIDVSSGDYIGILEPDDFVDAHMFEDLYRASGVAGGEARADIVKSSFYHYFDATDVRPQLIGEPRYAALMPDEVSVCGYEQFSEALRDHPSIWSAIYRRQFLVERGIRFVEPAGAGWADNPFAFETLCQAESMVWVPRAYYYYRCSNEGASSYLKDYNIPLDRLLDILDFFDRHGIRDARTLDLFNRRVFNYVFSILNGMDFESEQHELYDKVDRIMGRLDAELVVRSDLLGSQQKRLFKELTGRCDDAFGFDGPCDGSSLAVVMPFHNSCRYVYGALQKCLAGDEPGYSVVCLDEGESWDFTRRFAESVAARDGRVEWRRSSLADLVDQKAPAYWYFPGFRSSFEGAGAAEIRDTASSVGADMLVFGYCPEGVESRKAVPVAQVAGLMVRDMSCHMEDVALSCRTARALAGHEHGPLHRNGGIGWFLDAVLTAETVAFVPDRRSFAVKRSKACPSFRKPESGPDVGELEIGEVLQLRDVLERRGAPDAVLAAFPQLIARSALAGLGAQPTYERIARLLELYAEIDLQGQLGEGFFDRPVKRASSEELLYYALNEPGLYFRSRSAIDKGALNAKLADTRQNLADERKKSKAKSARIRKLEKQAAGPKAGRPSFVRRIIRKVVRTVKG